MRTSTLTVALLFALCTLTYAGSEPLPSGKESIAVAQAPAACPNWTGFYVGVAGGYKYGLAHPSINVSEDEGEDAKAIEAAGSSNLDASGAELGGLLGYNYQWHNWVFGLEADGAYLWLRNSNASRFSTPDDPLRFGEGYFESTSFKTHYLVTVGPRIGYAFCKWLPYITGGFAFGDIEFNQRIAELDDFSESHSRSETNVGAFVGAGVQYAISHHWSARLQYEFVYLGSATIDHHFDPSDENLVGTSKLFVRENNVSVALMYQF